MFAIYVHGCDVRREAVSDACTHGNCKSGWYSKYNNSEKTDYYLWAWGYPLVMLGVFSFLFQNTFKEKDNPNQSDRKLQNKNPPSDIKCPKCGEYMVRKKAFRGKHKGDEFWGCANYPNCKGIINITK